MSWVQKQASGNYRALYRDAEGKTRSAGTYAYKRRAITEAAEAEAKAHQPGWRDPSAAQKPWGEWCETWWSTRDVEDSTRRKDESPLNKYLAPRWNNTPLADITRQDVRAWSMELRRAGLAPSSVQRHVALFSASLTAAVDAEILSVNPARKLNPPPPQKDVARYLTPDEQARLLRQFAPPHKSLVNEALVCTLLGTGMRFGEAAGLQPKRVDIKRRYIRVIEVWDTKSNRLKAYTKGRKIRNVPIPEWLVPYLVARIATGEPRLFPVPYSNWYHRQWVPAVNRAGLPGVRPHDLRHTYASTLLQSGKVSLAEVGDLLGHVSSTTTQIYAHLAEDLGANIVAALPDPHGANV